MGPAIEWQRHGAALADLVRDAWLMLRPWFMTAVSVGGWWLGVYQLSIQPWHHLTFIWVGGFAAGVYGGYQAYRGIQDRVLVARHADGQALESDDLHARLRRLPMRYGWMVHEASLAD